MQAGVWEKRAGNSRGGRGRERRPSWNTLELELLDSVCDVRGLAVAVTQRRCWALERLGLL